MKKKMMRSEKLGLFELPVLGLLEATLDTDVAQLTKLQREQIVLAFGNVLKNAIAIKKEEYDESRRAELAAREAARNPDGSGIVGG